MEIIFETWDELLGQLHEETKREGEKFAIILK